MLADTHAHLNDDRLYGQAGEVVERAAQAGVGLIINASYDVESSRRGVALAARFPSVYTTVGLHPHDARTLTPALLSRLETLAGEPRVVAYGEIGLDYHYEHSPRAAQKEALVEQLRLADALGLPVAIHNRESHRDMLEMLQRHLPRAGGVMHCFSGSREFAAECVRLGLYVSLAGPVTFPSARRLREVAETVPLDRLLIETDCPYLAPVPHRGECNEPAYVRYVAGEICRVRGIGQPEFEEALERNVRALFGIPSPAEGTGTPGNGGPGGPPIV